MRNCTLLKGWHKLYTTTGLPYGFLVVEDLPAVLHVYDLKSGKEALKGAVEGGVFTGDQAGNLEAAMTEAGLAADMDGFFQKVKDFVLPEDHKPTHSFKLCQGCTRNPLPHGDIIAEDGSEMMHLADAWSGLEFCDKLVEDGKMPVLDGAAILKAAVEANLPMDKEDCEKRWEALPEETRRQFKRGRMNVTRVNIPGLGEAMILEI